MSIPVIFATSFLVGLSGAMMPGPLLTVTVAESRRWGGAAGPLVTLGHGILELLLVVGLVSGLGGVLGRPQVTGAIGLAGGGVLLWMGYGIISSALGRKVSLHLHEGPGVPRTRGLGPVVAGALASLANPYWILWWATLGAGYVAFSRQQGLVGLGTFYLGHVSSDLVWYSLISLAVTTGSRFISDNLYRKFLAVLGLFLVALALYFAYSGAKFLLSAI